MWGKQGEKSMLRAFRHVGLALGSGMTADAKELCPKARPVNLIDNDAHARAGRRLWPAGRKPAAEIVDLRDAARPLFG